MSLFDLHNIACLSDYFVNDPLDLSLCLTCGYPGLSCLFGSFVWLLLSPCDLSSRYIRGYLDLSCLSGSFLRLLLLLWDSILFDSLMYHHCTSTITFRSVSYLWASPIRFLFHHLFELVYLVTEYLTDRFPFVGILLLDFVLGYFCFRLWSWVLWPYSLWVIGTHRCHLSLWCRPKGDSVTVWYFLLPLKSVTVGISSALVLFCSASRIFLG